MMTRMQAIIAGPAEVRDFGNVAAAQIGKVEGRYSGFCVEYSFFVARV